MDHLDPRNMSCRPRHYDGMSLQVKRQSSGVIPQKVSDLENDLGFVDRKEVSEMIQSGIGMTGDFFINFLKSLSHDELFQIEQILDKYELPESDQDHTLEDLHSDDIDW